MNIFLEKFNFRTCLIISVILHSLLFLGFFIQQREELLRKKTRLIGIEVKENKDETPAEPPPPPRPSFNMPKDAVITKEPVEISAIETIDYEKIAKRPLLLQPTVGGTGGEAVPFAAVEVKPKLISQVKPEYPDFARKAEIEGLVVLSIIIDTTGNVINANVIKSLHALLDEAAIKAVMQWKFTPAMQRDHPVRVRMEVPIRFSLTEERTK